MSDPVKPVPEENAAPRRRGRPRAAGTRAAMVRAAASLLAEGGPPAVTMEAVAALAGVGKPTLYRYFANRHELAMAALIETVPSESGRPPARAGAASPVARLRTALAALARLFATPNGRNVASLMAAADRDSEVARAFRSHFIQARREEGAALLAAAAASGEIAADTDIETALDMIYGSVFYRLMMGHRPLDAAFTERVVDLALAALQPRDG